MLKFKFNYLQNTLAYQKEGNIWHELAEDRQSQRKITSVGFNLDHGWIAFTLYEHKIRAFYKKFDTDARFTYYRKDLPKECPVIFTFTAADQVEKINGKWTKKGGQP
ncbi:MAG: hypothetical protein MRECE_11c044 [Mycoplasmataceae bacterium CE_OT135]|nr:MAG: hypothetical protein MRECE_11c044 [Mycoplasmataceae bacterium CE_OT135]